MADKGLVRKLFGWGKSSPIPTKPGPEDIIGVDPLGKGKNLESSYYDRMNLPYEREEMYKLYDELDELGEISGVLSSYADDAIQTSLEHGVPMWFESPNKKVVEELTDLFYNVLDVEDWDHPTCRDVAKYGDQFPGLLLDDKEGVTGIREWVHPSHVKRVENQKGVLLGFLDLKQLDKKKSIDKSNLKKALLKPWEMVHFRLKGHNRMPNNDEPWIYGTAVLFAVRRSGRRLLLYSDLLFLYRLRNSFDRKIYYIDVGTEDLAASIEILKRWRKSLEKNRYVDWSGNSLRTVHDPMALGEHTYWPRRTGSTSSVDVIPGSANVADMADIDREENALFAGLRGPKEYWGFGSDGGMFDRDKSLALKDIRWGRAVSTVQRAYRRGCHRIGSIHLALKGIDPLDPKNAFKVQMVTPSVLEVLQVLEADATRAQLAEQYYRVGTEMELNPKEWKKHVLKKYSGLPDAMIKKLLKVPGEDGDEPDDEDSSIKDKKNGKQSFRASELKDLQEVLSSLKTEKVDLANYAPLTEWFNSSKSDEFVTAFNDQLKKDQAEKAKDDSSGDD